MINIKFCFCRESGEVSLAVRGHAGAGGLGGDPVCAGVSALVMALAGAVERMEQQGLLVCNTTAEDGSAQISAAANRDSLGEVLMAFWTVQVGLTEIARRHPDCVELEKPLRVD